MKITSLIVCSKGKGEGYLQPAISELLQSSSHKCISITRHEDPLPALQMMDQSHFPLQTHTEVSQCPGPDLHRCGGRTRTILADLVVICQCLRAAQKCVSAGSHQPLALHVSQSAMEEKACSWQGLFSLFCLHTQRLGTHQTITAV